MVNENETKEENKESKKPQQKDPKRVAAGKKGVEARKLKAELRKKEEEKLKKENIELKQAGELQVTKDDEYHQCPTNKPDSNKNYILPLCLSIVVGGLGLFFYYQSGKPEEMIREIIVGKEKPSEQIPLKKQKKEIDPFEFN